MMFWIMQVILTSWTASEGLRDCPGCWEHTLGAIGLERRRINPGARLPGFGPLGHTGCAAPGPHRQ